MGRLALGLSVGVILSAAAPSLAQQGTADFRNPSGDRRNTADFLRLSTLVATTGFPRQAQLGF